MIHNEFILPYTYLGDISYYHLIAKHSKVSISSKERYEKQTFRNRCVVCGANGPQVLSIPVSRPKGKDSTTQEIEISYAENWIKDHLKSLESAYARTPYFEFYIDQLSSIYQKKLPLLVDLDRELIEWVHEKLGLSAEIEFSRDSQPSEHYPIKQEFKTHRYIQSFEEKHGFHTNLCILDLLFHEGPNSISILLESSVITD